MAKGFASMPSSLSSGVDTRKASRDARARPWLTNSVLRRLSPVASVKVSRDAPLLTETRTVSTCPDPAPTVTVERLSEKLSSSKIPVLSLRCLSTSLGKDGVCGKVKSSAPPSTVTEMATSASRIPVRSNVSSSGPRLASLQQVRPTKPVVAYAGLPKGKEIGKQRGTGGKTTARPVTVQHFEEMSIRKCINPEPIRSHRSDIRVRSILKHWARLSEETDSRRPLASTGQGVKADPVSKKSVTWSEVEAIFTPARCWPMELVPSWKCRVCQKGRHQDWCSTMRIDEPSRVSRLVWLEQQDAKGYDYLGLSGGFLSVHGKDPTVRLVFF